jgi:PKD repeat protein
VLSGSTPVTVNLANFASGGTAQVWQLTSSNAIARLADLTVGSSIATSVPAQSITLFVIAAGGGTNKPPTAVASANPTSGTAPLAVIFSSAGSSDSDGSIAAYAWNFGDGGSSTSANPSHTYATAGNYSAVLTVTDNLGATGNSTVSVAVTNTVVPIAAPSNLQAAVTARRRVSLTWTDNSNNEQGFTIERATSPSTTFTQVGTVATNTTHFVQTGVAAGTYSYRVRAYNATTGQDSAYSNTATATVAK